MFVIGQVDFYQCIVVIEIDGDFVVCEMECKFVEWCFFDCVVVGGEEYELIIGVFMYWQYGLYFFVGFQWNLVDDWLVVGIGIGFGQLMYWQLEYFV